MRSGVPLQHGVGEIPRTRALTLNQTKVTWTYLVWALNPPIWYNGISCAILRVFSTEVSEWRTRRRSRRCCGRAPTAARISRAGSPQSQQLDHVPHF